MPRFHKGYRPTPATHPGGRGLGHPNHLLGALSLPASAAVPLGPVVDQGDASSCVGNSTAIAIQAAGGQPFGDLPARRYLYAMARAKGSGQPLVDEGAIIADAFGAASEVGYPAESAMPYTDDPIAINAMPDLEAIREAIDQAPSMVNGAYRIVTSGAARVRDVAAAIAAGHCVVWGTELDQAFEDLGPRDVWPGVRGMPIGGHAMVLWAYRTNPVGRLEFASRSSWTASFADGGSAWCAESAISSPDADDFWIVSVARKLDKAVA